MSLSSCKKCGGVADPSAFVSGICQPCRRRNCRGPNRAEYEAARPRLASAIRRNPELGRECSRCEKVRHVCEYRKGGHEVTICGTCRCDIATEASRQRAEIARAPANSDAAIERDLRAMRDAHNAVREARLKGLPIDRLEAVAAAIRRRLRIGAPTDLRGSCVATPRHAPRRAPATKAPQPQEPGRNGTASACSARKRSPFETAGGN